MGRRNNIGASGDLAEVRKLLLFQFDRAAWPAIECRERERAERLVNRYWNAVAEVAACLSTDGRVSGRDVTTIVRRTRHVEERGLFTPPSVEPK
jgi:hypothetical protein